MQDLTREEARILMTSLNESTKTHGINYAAKVLPIAGKLQHIIDKKDADTKNVEGVEN